MSNFFTKLVSPTALLYIYLTLSNIARGIYLAGDIEPPPGFSLFQGIALFWIIAWWLLMDSRKRGVVWVYDIGMFLYIAWPFIMPYYLLKTRGAKGLLVILAFIAVYAVAVILGVGLYLLLAPPTG